MCGIVGLHLRNPELYPAARAIGDRHVVRDGRSRQRLDRRRRLRRPDLVSARTRMRLAARGRREPRRGGGRAGVSVTQLGRDVSPYRTRPRRRTSSPPPGPPIPTRSSPASVPISRCSRESVIRASLTERWGLAEAQGWQGVGHTRMATESAVTPAGCHPYAVGPEQCMVHNGSFANHATIRRELRAAGVRFDSENDTEVGARFIAASSRDGRDVEARIEGALCRV